MIKLIIGLVVLVLSIILIVLGLFNYASRYSDTPDKDNFSFLNQFPYEMQDNPTMKYNLWFRIVASLLGAGYASFGMYLFYFVHPYDYKSLAEIILGIIFIIIGITIFSFFAISLKNYRLHLISTSSLFAFTVCNYVLFGYYILMEANDKYPGSVAYVLFVIGAALLASLIFTPLKRWMYLEKEEKDGTVRYYRKRISILPFMEWIFLFSDIVLVLIIAFI